MAKVTFSLDDATVRTLRQVATFKRKPQSQVVREAIVEYAAREEKLPDEERERRLSILRAVAATPVTRTTTHVDLELRHVRRSRAQGWSRPSD